MVEDSLATVTKEPGLKDMAQQGYGGGEQPERSAQPDAEERRSSSQ